MRILHARRAINVYDSAANPAFGCAAIHRVSGLNA